MNTDLWHAIPVALILASATMSCSRAGGQSEHLRTAVLPDTLRVGTLYSPTSYFVYRDEPMGYDYALVRQFTKDRDIVLELVVGSSLPTVIEMLDSGKIDLIAAEVPVTAEYRSHAVPCGPDNLTSQVLVQPKRRGRDTATLVTDVTQLAGKDIYVEEGSKYQYRLINLNEEIGGGINIHPIDRDTLITEDLIAMVSNGSIPMTVVDSDIAQINRTYYPNLDISLQLSFPQRASWAVSPKHPWLADSINAWMQTTEHASLNATLLKKYFEMSKNTPRQAMAPAIDFSRGYISPFDTIFRRVASAIHWDWRLLAAQGWTESRFDTAVVSWAGARGIMQIMPRTAQAFDLDKSLIDNPSANIAAAGRILEYLDKSLTPSVPDPNERIKFSLAAYNAGLAHIKDAIALARKYGKNPQKWDGNVAEMLLLKSNPDYFNDPVCKFGYFRGRQATAYVESVMDFYHKASRSIPV